MISQNSFSIEFERRYSTAHRLLNDDSVKCMVPHGHNEYVRVGLETNKNRMSDKLDGNRNMVAEFGDLKKRWHDWIDNHVDHAFQVNELDPIISYFNEHEHHFLERILVTPGDPTTEVLTALFQSKLQSFLDDQFGSNLIKCMFVTVQETPTNSVTIKGYRQFDYVLRQDRSGCEWWSRPDFSINDLSI